MYIIVKPGKFLEELELGYRIDIIYGGKFLENVLSKFWVDWMVSKNFKTFWNISETFMKIWKKTREKYKFWENTKTF